MVSNLALSLACLSLPLLSLSHRVQNPHAGLLRRQTTQETATTIARGRRPTIVGEAAIPTRRRTSAVTAATTTTAALVVPVGSAPVPLATTYAAGSVSPIEGAPLLPDYRLINPADYPPLDRLPPLDSAEMLQWISEIDMDNIPNIPPTQLGGCQNASNTAAIANAGAAGSCWWTCGGCTRDSDISFCPTKSTWGLSFDDGPAASTPKLLNYLAEVDLLSTFFVVGSRVVTSPQTLQATYMAGHQISVHTWAHPLLTTLTNEGIIAELAWSKAAIKAVTGVTPNTMRPPYGDIDDRVRYISEALGLTPILWSTVNGESYDTEDWRVTAGVAPAQVVLDKFESIIDASAVLDTGFIVLAHDLHPTTVDLAVEHVLPQALAFVPALTLQPILTCLGQSSSQGYIETYVRDTNDTNVVSQVQEDPIVEDAVLPNEVTTEVETVSAGGRLGAGSWAALVVVLGTWVVL